ncbi:cytochrome P450 [Amycolatopsis circi]|uniref:cytochrome P450 n=1 Tax=Amycolatopsis circi TaxID=871959 RepID=UPI001FC921BC|nr:cytochrome P450 [Amycolatopsis circi]
MSQRWRRPAGRSPGRPRWAEFCSTLGTGSDCLGSANRDERHFSDGDVFRVDRGRVRPAHLGWGSGAHRCLGRHLARLELRVMLQELLAALPNMRIQADARPRRTYGVIRGVREVPVEWATTG